VDEMHFENQKSSLSKLYNEIDKVLEKYSEKDISITELIGILELIKLKKFQQLNVREI